MNTHGYICMHIYLYLYSYTQRYIYTHMYTPKLTKYWLSNT